MAKALLRAFAVATVVAAATWSPSAHAQAPDELRAARELFQEAYKDEQEARFPEALEKFKRVAKVKESASVRYRIATVLAAMGRLREARDMYRALAAARPTLPTSDRDTADSAAEKAAALDKRIPHLSLRLEDNPPPEPKVTLDGAPVPVSTTSRSIELDPGEHVIAAAARGASSPEQKVMLVEGAPEVSATVMFTPDKPVAPPPPPPPAEKKRDLLPWVAIAGGAVFVVAGTGLLVARNSAINDIHDHCPSNFCVRSLKDQVESDQNRAAVFGPVGIGLGVLGLAAIGLGIYLLVHPRPVPTATSSYQVGRDLVLRW
jgi:hypothetical protein